jgi:hypothetical protein
MKATSAAPSSSACRARKERKVSTAIVIVFSTITEAVSRLNNREETTAHAQLCIVPRDRPQRRHSTSTSSSCALSAAAAEEDASASSPNKPPCSDWLASVREEGVEGRLVLPMRGTRAAVRRSGT